MRQRNRRAKRKPHLQARKAPFPSARQSRATGLHKQRYRPYSRDLVDCDYIGKLGEKERIWLAAFLEEYYAGWRLANETQVLPAAILRETNAAHSRRRRNAPYMPRENLAARPVSADGDRAVIELVGDACPEETIIRNLDRRARFAGPRGHCQRVTDSVTMAKKYRTG